jgi:hypothetical protein
LQLARKSLLVKSKTMNPTHKKIIIAIGALGVIALGAVLVLQNNPPSPSQCGVANCHGLDIECGTPVQMCTEMYQLGDKCRQYAKCGVVSGTCQQIESPEFTACKSCALKCENDNPNDPDKAFVCESKCR